MNIRPMITENTRIEDVQSTLCQKQGVFFARTMYSGWFVPVILVVPRSRTETGEPGAPLRA